MQRDPVEEAATAINGSGPVSSRWPELDDAALHGVVGEVIRTIEPHTESGTPAILVQFLVAFGNAIGRGTGFTIEADFHGTNLFAIVVGRSSKSRKGTSWGHVRRLLTEADPNWRVVSGLASGEGLVYAVRDPQTKMRRAKRAEVEAGDADEAGYIEELDDPGAEDKRACVVESEFAGVLRQMRRDGNILSIIVRQAWDSGDLQSLVKNNPMKATGAHISLIGHITEPELRRELTNTDSVSGFANRFLFVCSERSKELPEGGNLSEADFNALVEMVRDAMRFGEITDQVVRNAEARELWCSVYSQLSRGVPGLVGAMTSRAEAQVLRLSVVYAILDQSNEVCPEHIEAALAVWRYCEDSCRYVFGEAIGDPDADDILDALRGEGPNGLTRTEISVAVFQRHKRSEEIDRALGILESLELAQRVIEQDGPGRPTERWIACEISEGSEPILVRSHISPNSHPLGLGGGA